MVNKVDREMEFSEKELVESLKEATKRGEESLSNEPRAAAVVFDEKEKLITIRLTNGGMFGFPTVLIKELRNARPEEIANVTLTPLGTGLHWDDLDAHYTVAGLINGVFGTKAWMKELGRKGGSQRSRSKAEAARRNGAKGGRPKKSVVPMN